MCHNIGGLPVVVHPRIERRHPELGEEDVLAAWRDPLFSIQRPGGDQWVVLGYDERGRLLEMIAVLQDSQWIVFHAMTPPTKKIKAEIASIRRRTR